MWIVFLVLYFVFSTGLYLYRKQIARDLQHDRLIVNAFAFIFMLAPAGLVLGLTLAHDFDIGIVNALLLFFGSFIWPLDWIIAFRANQKVDVGVFTVISNIAPVITLVLGVGLLGETLLPSQVFGGLLLVVSGLVVSVPLLRKRHIAGNELLYSLLAAAGLGLGIVFERFMLTRIDFGTYLMFGWSSQAVWMAVFARKQLSRVPQILSKPTKSQHVFIYGGLLVLEAVCFITALKLSAGASIMGPASNFLGVVVIFAAYFVLREHDHLLNKIAAAFIGLAGLILIAR